jgi:hypothetical protein
MQRLSIKNRVDLAHPDVLYYVIAVEERGVFIAL